MPHYVGRRLTDVRRDAKAAFDEDQLRAILIELLGALEAFHAFGSAHGGVSPDNVLLLQNGRPVLLRPRAQGRETPGEPIDTLRGYLHLRNETEDTSAGSATGPWTDVRDAARVIRFLMAGERSGNPSRVRGGKDRPALQLTPSRPSCRSRATACRFWKRSMPRSRRCRSAAPRASASSLIA
jgi:serine/threonine protein kinase